MGTDDRATLVQQTAISPSKIDTQHTITMYRLNNLISRSTSSEHEQVRSGCTDNDAALCGISLCIGALVGIAIVAYLVWKISLCIKARGIRIDMEDFE
ncbi:hypothetical protein DOTSEDRAFT_74922 [Dothistroma septosporum NZE10]|uniref:Uncharacterized protein n=1 Tax=Dothistroma septosporum (strain NZE10 / CBS 128990) TaxID=675120 RepID=N1PFC9_DOTSN|nr:hypothetical protein DOTSEDRAFT_74922 [Dothistroma septosporum NZE10]